MEEKFDIYDSAGRVLIIERPNELIYKVDKEKPIVFKLEELDLSDLTQMFSMGRYVGKFGLEVDFMKEDF